MLARGRRSGLRRRSDGERRVVADLAVRLAVDLAGRFLDPFDQQTGSPLGDAGVVDPAFLIGLELHGIACLRDTL